MEPNIKLNDNALNEEQSYSVELGGQHFTQAQWEVLQAYAKGYMITRIRQEISRQQEGVVDFHTGMGLPVGHTPQQLPADRVPVRWELVREEVQELLVALGWAGTDPITGHPIFDPAKFDLVEVVDAGLDIVYVVYGLFVEMGVNATPLFEEVQASNMSKFGADGKAIIAGPNDPDGIFPGRVKKGPNYFKPNLKAVLESGLADLGGPRQQPDTTTA
jgi:predicted HAD superfamily Cof-like phosphohydrolase